jgi:hypothetical protein
MDGKNHESKTADHRPNSFQLAKYRSSRAIRRKKFQFPAVPGNENAKFLSFLLYNSFSSYGLYGGIKITSRKSLADSSKFISLDINIVLFELVREKIRISKLPGTKMRNYFPP